MAVISAIIFNGSARFLPNPIFGKSLGWQIGSSERQRMVNFGGSDSCPTENSAHLKMCHPQTKFVAHLKVFAFAFTQVKICVDKSDRVREMGKILLASKN